MSAQLVEGVASIRLGNKIFLFESPLYYMLEFSGSTIDGYPTTAVLHLAGASVPNVTLGGDDAKVLFEWAKSIPDQKNITPIS